MPVSVQGAVDKGASQAGELVAALPTRAGSLVVDATHVYAVGMDEKRLFRIAKTSGATERLALGARSVTAAGLDASHVYWIDRRDAAAPEDPRRRIARMRKEGGRVEELATGAYFVPPLVSDGTSLFFAEARMTYATPRAGVLLRVDLLPPAAPVVVARTPYARTFAVDREAVYFAGESGGTVTVERVPKGGGASTRLWRAPAPVNFRADGFWRWVPDEIALGARDVYFTPGVSSDSQEWFELDVLPKSGGDTRRRIPQRYRPMSIVIDGDDVYASALVGGTCAVVRWQSDAVEPRILARDEDATTIAVDDARVYWTSYHQIRTIAK
jgi:hypothetical protein